MRKSVGSRQSTVGKAFSLGRRLVLLLFVFSAILCNYCCSQNIVATATLDTNSILIGQKTKIKLRIEYLTDQGEVKIDFPKVGDTIIKQIEVVERSKVERFIPDSNDMSRLAQMQSFIITSFDSGYYAIPPFRFIINGDTGKPIETEPLLFAVNTVEVDTTKNIKDIKPPIDVPFSWKELLPYAYAGLGILAGLAAIILAIRYFIRKRKKKPVPVIVAPKIPPHVTAIERLEKLKEAKLWQQGKTKEYHSEISDIIREYIEHRFYIHAMEQVSDEIMHSFRTADVSEESRIKLRQVLYLSDLVKFAKEQPLPNENDLSWNNAFEFISATKTVEEKKEPIEVQNAETPGGK